ncbi:restriction endonuclease subunit S [Thermodesulfobacteriota bacterium]
MTDRNENRPEYKKTQVGWIPQNWEVRPFETFLKRVRKKLEVEPDREYREIGIRSHGKGIFHKNPIIGNQLGNKSVFWVKTPTLIFNIVFAWEQAVAVTGKKEQGMIASHRFPTYAVNDNNIDLNFVRYYFLTKRGKYLLGLASPGGAGRNKTLGQNELNQLPIIIPPLVEQKKIAEILSTWDNAIEQTLKLIDAKKRRKKALMQQLLTGKKRLPGFKEEWKEYPMGELFKERRETNYSHLSLLAITGNQGIIPASEIDRKDSSNEDKSKYKRIMPGDIGYNTMRMWQGVSAVSTLEGIVSPAYTICILQNTVDVNFMGYFFKFPTVINLFWRYSQRLVSDTLNLKYNNFSEIKVLIPPKEEQRRIAQILSTADNGIYQLEARLKVLEKQKRGLMQKLLTGEVRVKL